MTDYLLQFGSIVFPPTFKPVSLDSPLDTASQERPRADGSIQQAVRRKERKLVVQGDIVGPLATFRAVFDTIKGACMAQGLAALYFGQDDRLIMCQCTGGTESWADDGAWYGGVNTMQLTFLAPDPFFEAASSSDFDLGTTGATVTASGNAPTKPAFTVTIGTGSAGAAIVTNTTTGEAMSVNPAFLTNAAFAAGDTIAVDRETYTVLYNGVATFGLLTGQIPTLAAGGNVFTVGIDDTIGLIDITGAPTGGTFTLSYGGDTTAAIAWNAAASDIQSALQALASVGTDNALVGGTGPFTVAFAGTLLGTAVTGIAADGSGLTGGVSPGVSVPITSVSDVSGTYTARWF